MRSSRECQTAAGVAGLFGGHGVFLVGCSHGPPVTPVMKSSSNASHQRGDYGIPNARPDRTQGLRAVFRVRRRRRHDGAGRAGRSRALDRAGGRARHQLPRHRAVLRQRRVREEPGRRPARAAPAGDRGQQVPAEPRRPGRYPGARSRARSRRASGCSGGGASISSISTTRSRGSEASGASDSPTSWTPSCPRPCGSRSRARSASSA